jgi:predicted nucleic acid-binding protein
MIRAGALAYLDSSIIARAVLADEAHHDATRDGLVAARDRLVTWCGTRVELASALRAAESQGRVVDAANVTDWAFVSGPRVMLLPGDPATIVPLAADIAGRQLVRALDALHIAAALTEAAMVAGDAPLLFVTGDQRQAHAARAEGLEVVVPV